ncbi:MAG TPA: type II toxin-antitoxin system VapB family antitoxin [Thermodesulfobacteriota bacterium]|jgi:Arc/MetJ family transcription regulator|nr:type II toxin-antitoxin system VapB family antitoxin [Thermodesulfobacteriota bacterium]
MKKTTVFVDEVLIELALKASKLRTKKEVIEAGLKELVRKKNRDLLRGELGTFDIALSLDELKKRRAGR